MVQIVEAIYENGVPRPLEPLDLKESERVRVSVSPDLAGRPSRSAVIEGMIDHKLVAYARAKVAGLDHIPTLEEVRAGLSTIKGSMAEAVIAERGEY